MAEDKSDEEIVKVIEENARHYQFKYHGCSQTCLLALQEGLGIGDLASFKAASGMAAGFGGKGVGLCGALVGAAMAIGIEFGRAALEEIGLPQQTGSSNYSRSYALCGELFEEFKKAMGDQVTCWGVQEFIFGRHYDSSDPDVQKEKETGDYFRRMSLETQNVVAVAARLAAEIILRERRVDAERGKHYFAINQPPTREECLRLLGRTTSAVTGKEIS
ncbi:hypothetical protein ES707_08546 [subsurface metagenome]